MFSRKRNKVTKCHQSFRPDPVTSGPDPVKLVEILPPKWNQHPVWNSRPIQADFSIGSAWQEADPVQLAKHFLPKDPSEGRIARLTSPFEDFHVDPEYPDRLHYNPGAHSKCEVLLETPDSNYALKYETEAIPGPSHRPPTPPFKRHMLYRYNRASILPVPYTYEPGRKINYSKLGGKEEAEFFAQERKNMIVNLLRKKEIYDEFRSQSIAHGNQYYLEWERRQIDAQRDIWDQFKWDIETQRYFSRLRAYDLGKEYNRPKPILLINESVTNLLREDGSETDTPVNEYENDTFDDITVYPELPDPLRPFLAQVNRPWLWKLRERRGPSFVPGGYLYHFYDVRETGQIFTVEEMEFAPLWRLYPDLVQPPVRSFLKVH
jgi:hypothetical protein